MRFSWFTVNVLFMRHKFTNYFFRDDAQLDSSSNYDNNIRKRCIIRNTLARDTYTCIHVISRHVEVVHGLVMQALSLYTVEYRQSAPPIFTLGWQERGGGRINGSDRFCTRGAPSILISAPRPCACAVT